MSQAHFDKYEEMARSIGIERLIEAIPFRADSVRHALDTGDEHLNTLPLSKWDNAVGFQQYEMGHTEPCPCCKTQRRVKWTARQFCGMAPFEGGPHTASERVCVLKHVARYYLAEGKTA